MSLLICAVMACALHECGHLVTALALGVRVKKVGISWKGFCIVRESGPPLDNLLISLAGPFTNLLLAGACMQHPMSDFALANLIIGLFNLAPIPSSDGLRAARLFVRNVWR